MFESMIPVLAKAERIGIFAHCNPDGDSMGSAYALKLALTAQKKQAEVYLLPHPDAMAYPLIHGREDSGLNKEDCDLLVAVDCADSKRLGEYERFFLSHGNTLAIDHHITHKSYAKVTVAEDVSSTAELIFDLLTEWQMPMNKEIAENLYIGLVCDTGNFKFSCVSAHTFAVAGALLGYDIAFARISKRIFSTKSRAYYRLMQTALERLEFFADGKVCSLFLSEQDFLDAGIDESEAGGIVTLPGGIEGVEVGIYIRRRDAGEYKVSLRSAEAVDVAAVAEVFGGGGHLRAAGYSVTDAEPSQITTDALTEIQKQL